MDRLLMVGVALLLPREVGSCKVSSERLGVHTLLGNPHKARVCSRLQ